MVQTISSPHCIIGTRMTRIERINADSFALFIALVAFFLTAEGAEFAERVIMSIIKFYKSWFRQLAALIA